MKDLAEPKWMYLKAALLLVIGVTCVALLFLDQPTLRTAVLLALAVWAFCRAYYFAFYVIGKYVDPAFRFSGLWSFVRYLTRRNRK
ncbi:MAG: hypothetical protein HZA89_16550 [Verrucomicrobia bacterium]|nr:hypothetical protein [Verrucomicrobiota bacterium]